MIKKQRLHRHVRRRCRPDRSGPEHAEGRCLAVEPDGHYALKGLADDPIVKAADQGPRN